MCRVYQKAKEIKQAKRHRYDAIISNKRGRHTKKGVPRPVYSAKGSREMPAMFVAQNKHKFTNLQELTCSVIEDLTENGFSVIDNFLDETTMDDILSDVKGLYASAGRFLPGMLSVVKTSAKTNHGEEATVGNQVTDVDRKTFANNQVTKNIRGDMVTWIDIHPKTRHFAIKKAVTSMNSIINLFNKPGNFYGCDIQSRSRVMAACYPGNGARYKQHVDNPTGDGRKLTCILYLNKNYEQKRDGGVLRMHPKDSGFHFDIQPISGRLVIFWSDSRNPHEVLPVYSERFAISVWYFDIVERAKSFIKSSTVLTS